MHPRKKFIVIRLSEKKLNLFGKNETELLFITLFVLFTRGCPFFPVRIINVTGSMTSINVQMNHATDSTSKRTQTHTFLVTFPSNYISTAMEPQWLEQFGHLADTRDESGPHNSHIHPRTDHFLSAAHKPHADTTVTTTGETTFIATEEFLGFSTQVLPFSTKGGHSRVTKYGK